jgi:hypothetical protein
MNPKDCSNPESDDKIRAEEYNQKPRVSYPAFVSSLISTSLGHPFGIDLVALLRFEVVPLPVCE